jgi:hypothetical protein
MWYMFWIDSSHFETRQVRFYEVYYTQLKLQVHHDVNRFSQLLLYSFLDSGFENPLFTATNKMLMSDKIKITRLVGRVLSSFSNPLS